MGAEPAPPGQQLTYTVRAQGRLVEPEEFANVIVRENPDGSSGAREGRRAHRARVRSTTSSTAPSTASPPRSSPRSRRRARTRSTWPRTSARRWPTWRSASRRASSYKVSLDTTAPVKAGIREIVETLLEAIAARRARRLRVPAELARDAHPAAHRAGVARRARSPCSRCSASRSTRCRSSGSCWRSASSSTTPSSSSRRSSTTSRRAWRRARRRFTAMREVQGPVIAIALILAAVFIPVAFMSGVTGRLYQQFALTIAVSVLISAFNALTLSPALSALLLRPRSAPTRRRRPARAVPSTAGSAARPTATSRQPPPRAQARHPARPARGRRRGVLVRSARKLPPGFVPDEDQGYAIIGVQLPDGASLQRTKAVYEQDRRHPGQGAGRSHLQRRRRLQLLHAHGGELHGHGLRLVQAVGRAQGAGPVVERDRRRASTPRSRKSPRGASSPWRRPAIPGISAAGGFSMMLQDKSGGSYEFLAQNVRQVRRRGAQAARARGQCARTSRPRCRSSSRTSTRTRR